MEGADGHDRRFARAAAAFAAFLLPLLLAACASIPLSTMWKMRSFDRTTLMQLAPVDLRVATTLQPRVPIIADSVRLSLILLRDPDGADEEHVFALEPSREPGPAAGGDEVWQAWRLDAGGRAAFAEAQRKLRAADAGEIAAFTGATFKVDFKPDFAGRPPAELTLSVQLLLEPADGWFVLVDEYTLPVTPEAATP